MTQRILALQQNMMSFACQLTGDRQKASDLLQDTTLKVLDNEEKYSENVNFKGWVLTIMRNIFINNYRKSSRRNTVIDTSKDLLQLNLPQDSGFSSPEGSIAMEEIVKTLHAIPPEFKVPFTMYVKGYRYNEIAEYLHLPLGTVKSRIFFARKRLKAALKDYR